MEKKNLVFLEISVDVLIDGVWTPHSEYITTNDEGFTVDQFMSEDFVRRLRQSIERSCVQAKLDKPGNIELRSIRITGNFQDFPNTWNKFNKYLEEILFSVDWKYVDPKSPFTV